MDSRRLGLFLAVADEGGFTRAARAVFLSQPALSQGIKELETELGVGLFHRLGRRVVLTAAGEALIGPARQVLRDMETGRAAVAAVAGLEGGRLELCALPTLAADPLAPLVGAFRRAHPAVAVDLAAPDDPAALIELVQSGVCELGITEAGAIPADLVVHALLSQDLLAVLPPGTARPAEPMRLAELARFALIATPTGTSSRRIVDHAFAAAGLTANIGVVTAQREAILPLVLAGAGATVQPRPLAETAAVLGATVTELTPGMTRDVVVTHRRGPLSPAAAAFLALSTGQ